MFIKPQDFYISFYLLFCSFLQLGGTQHLKGRRQVADKLLEKVAMQVAIEGCNQDCFFVPHQI
jgi:hypothetical protein